MNDQADTDRTAALLRAALTAAADLMVIPDAPKSPHENQNNAKSPKSLRTPSSHKRTSQIWAPLAAAVGVVAIAAGTVIGAHLTSPSAPRPAQSQSQSQGATGTTARPPRPEFYLTATHPFAQNVVQFQVRRTNGGAVTDERTIPTANVGWGGYLAAARRPHLLLRSVHVHHRCALTHHVRPDRDHQRRADHELRARPARRFRAWSSPSPSRRPDRRWPITRCPATAQAPE